MSKRIPFDLNIWMEDPEIKVFTRAGRQVFGLHYFEKENLEYCLAGVVNLYDSVWRIVAWTKNGSIDYTTENSLDLFLEMPLKLKPFNLQEWLDKNKPDCYTADGIKVNQLTYFQSLKHYPLVGVCACWFGGVPSLKSWSNEGIYCDGGNPNITNLMLVDED